jgi:hypothetical protein
MVIRPNVVVGKLRLKRLNGRMWLHGTPANTKWHISLLGGYFMIQTLEVLAHWLFIWLDAP